MCSKKQGELKKISFQKLFKKMKFSGFPLGYELQNIAGKYFFLFRPCIHAVNTSI